MAGYIRAKHPSPEAPTYNDSIPDDELPGCGDTVLLQFEDVPPVAKGDVFRNSCPSCNRTDARLEAVEVPSND